MKNFKLCYIDGDTAYFTTQELSRQTGDDWNDVECNTPDFILADYLVNCLQNYHETIKLRDKR